MGGRGAGGAGSAAGLGFNSDTGLAPAGRHAALLVGLLPPKRAPPACFLCTTLQSASDPPTPSPLPGCLLHPRQLLGLASSVLLLQALEAAGHPEAAIPAWAAAHSVHVALRYVALRSLRFPWPNQVGAC